MRHGQRRSLGSNALERNAEELDSIPSGDAGIERDTLFRRSVFCWRERIEHLQWIAAAHRARNHAGNILRGKGRGPMSLARMMPGLKRNRMRASGGGISSSSRWLDLR